jgi:thiol:disulfide interchange protein
MLTRVLRSLAWGALAALAGCASIPLPVVDRYDPARNAQADLDAALAAAPRAQRQVLVVVGGDWCKDCRDLDKLIAEDTALRDLRDRRYVPVKVYLGQDNRNEAVLARFPPMDWVPTLIVLDGQGRVVRYAPSTEFHQGKALDAAKLRAFLDPSPNEARPWK